MAKLEPCFCLVPEKNRGHDEATVLHFNTQFAGNYFSVVSAPEAASSAPSAPSSTSLTFFFFFIASF